MKKHTKPRDKLHRKNMKNNHCNNAGKGSHKVK